MTTFNISLLGAKGVGKSSLFLRHSTGNFHEVVDNLIFGNLHFQTSIGEICFHINEGSVGPTIQGIIILFSVTDKKSFKQAIDIAKEFPEIPKIICGNKIDMRAKKISYYQILTAFFNLETYLTSSKSLYNYDKPFLALTRKLTGSDLEFL